MKKETKKFEYQKNGDLKVTVKAENELVLPGHNGEKVPIGVYIQHTTQVIDKKSLSQFKSYVQNELDATKARIEKVREGLKQLKNVNENLIPEEVVKAAKEGLSKSKGFRKSMKALNDFVAKVERKKLLGEQLAYFENQLRMIEDDHKEIFRK